MKTKIASQESDLFLSDVLTNSTSNIYLLLFFYAGTFSPLQWRNRFSVACFKP